MKTHYELPDGTKTRSVTDILSEHPAPPAYVSDEEAEAFRRRLIGHEAPWPSGAPKESPTEFYQRLLATRKALLEGIEGSANAHDRHGYCSDCDGWDQLLALAARVRKGE